MCFLSQPKIPKPKPLPRTPTIDSDAVRMRQQTELQQLQAMSGTAATVKTDLASQSLSGDKKVLLGV